MRKQLAKERKDLEVEAAEAAAASKHIPKSFNYYCPSCLYQTNEDPKKCPKCGFKPLKETDR
jgi:rubrerythrin